MLFCTFITPLQPFCWLCFIHLFASLCHLASEPWGAKAVLSTGLQGAWHLEYWVWAAFDAVTTLFFTSTHWPRSLESLGSFYLTWLNLAFWVYFSTLYLPFDEETELEQKGTAFSLDTDVLKSLTVKETPSRTIAAYFLAAQNFETVKNRLPDIVTKERNEAKSEILNSRKQLAKRLQWADNFSIYSRFSSYGPE